LIGKNLAHFEVLSKVGEGGMGVVYRARDTKLGRDVALKVLPESFTQDGERLARFRREAKVLASLNHPNIASIYGLEESDGQLFLVMELAEGEDLSERLERGAIGPDETLEIAKQLVAGLEEAHEGGVVHRDLKPANIKLSEEGKVKILDFGLARAWAEDPQAEEDLANSPTITAAMTQAGVILGTAAYMSPEQARGKTVDRRADIWALGVILFETLTGERLFEGETVSDTLAGVLKTDVDFDRLPEDTPEELRWLIVRSLQRQPGNRLRDVGEARIALDGGDPNLSMSWSAVTIPEEGSQRPARTGLLVALALVIGAAGAWFLRPAPAVPPAEGFHAAVLAPEFYNFRLEDAGHFALSPDGSTLAFVAVDSNGTSSLWVRKLGVAAPYELSGTTDAEYPFWSPDSAVIGFFSQGRMRKIDAGGGVATTICPAPTGRGGSWTPEGSIFFAPTNRDPIHVVSAAGGESRAVTVRDSLEPSHRWPDVLPDGRHLLFTVRTDDDHRLAAVPIGGGERTILLEGVLEGRFDDGHVFFSRDNALWARPFDPSNLEFTGDEFLIAEMVVASNFFGGACYATSERGNIVYASTKVEESGYFVSIDPDGNEEYRFRSDDEGYMDRLCLSPDERLMALKIAGGENLGDSDLWIRDLRRSTMTRFTTGENADDPHWSPDGERIAYLRDDTNLLVIREARGARTIISETQMSDAGAIHDWSPDGRYLLASLLGPAGRDICLLPVDDPANAIELISDESFNVQGAFSPDSRWIVHMSTVTGRAEVYLRSIEAGGDSYQVSTNGGVWPSFSPDGSAIYFADFDNRLTAVSVDWSGEQPELGMERIHRNIALRDGRNTANPYVARRDGGFYYMGDSRSGAFADIALDLVVGWRSLILGE
jgi:serine/threonine-protein kinase